MCLVPTVHSHLWFLITCILEDSLLFAQHLQISCSLQASELYYPVA